MFWENGNNKLLLFDVKRIDLGSVILLAKLCVGKKRKMLLLLNCSKCEGQPWRESKHLADISKLLCTDAQVTNHELRVGKIKMAPLTHLWQNCGSETTIRSYCQANYNNWAIIPNHHFHFF